MKSGCLMVGRFDVLNKLDSIREMIRQELKILFGLYGFRFKSCFNILLICVEETSIGGLSKRYNGCFLEELF